ncbi:uncharacterized protein LOC126671656 [Mercurialis annua]|uniref:uncharacterized protein LOC126671656 n=1 Tax=Mercurialis annua TaxID=3986 RepID=UPI00215F41AC|nr:uncharacterized protein LOC126671656 [Mercurialis annua]
MRCKNHLTDLSSSVGVCASCLRERLLPLSDVQSPPTLVFARCKSHEISPSDHGHHIPQVICSTSITHHNSDTKHHTRFSLLSKLFRSKSDKFHSSTTNRKYQVTEYIYDSSSHKHRGMSPVSEANIDGPPSRMMTPSRVNAAYKSKKVSGLAFCFSPLVRLSPNTNSHWKQKVNLTSELGKSRLSTAASFCGNRSRKLYDLGRLNLNLNR